VGGAAAGQENAPPRAAAAGGMGGVGGIASTIAAARSEADEMPQPMRLSRPGGNDGPKPTLLSGRGLAGRGGMMPGRGIGGRGGGGRGLIPMRAGGAAGEEGRAAMASHYDHDDGDDGLTSIPSLPTLGDAPKGGGPAPARPRLIDQLKPPTFDDDIDEDELAAEEAAILARKKARAAGATGGAGGGAASMVEGVHRAGSSAAVKPADIPPAPAPKKSFGAPPQSTKVAGNSPMGPAGLDIDIDDLFEEEVVL